jgi:glycosyltransferase involved in cell wall biosynthesis
MAEAPAAGVELAGLRVSLIAGTLGVGGAERQFYYIARALVRAGSAVSVTCLTSGEYWEEKVRDLGADVLSIPRDGSSLRRLTRTVATARAHRPDVVQSIHFFTNLHATLAGIASRAPSVGGIRGDLGVAMAQMARPIGVMCLRWPSVIAANSIVASQQAMACGVPACRVTVLANVVECADPLEPPRQAVARCRVAFVGRLVHAKRHDVFLDACGRLARSGLALSVTVAGDGPLRGALERQAATLPSGMVRFLGETHDVNVLLAESDVLVLSSDHEGTPNVLLEAACAGLPVVATAVGGVPDIVGDGTTGILVPPDDPAALASALARLAGDPKLRRRMGDAARLRVLADHGANRLPGDLAALYARAGVQCARVAR